MLETLVDYNDRNNSPLSNEKIQQAVSRVMAETEEEERDAERDFNNVTIDTFFNQYPVTNNTQGDIATVTSVHFTISTSQGEITNVTSERQISSEIMAETINGFNELKIQSTINDSAYDDSEEDDAESDPNSDPKVATYTTNRKSPQKLFTNREIPAIIQGVIPPVNQTTADGVKTSRRALHAVHEVLHKEIVTGATRITAGVLKYPLVINWKDASGTIAVDKKTVGIPPQNH